MLPIVWPEVVLFVRTVIYCSSGAGGTAARKPSRTNNCHIRVQQEEWMKANFSVPVIVIAGVAPYSRLASLVTSCVDV